MDQIMRRLDQIYSALEIPPERLRQELLDERDELLDQLCETYLSASPKQRAEIRQFFEGKQRPLMDLVDRVARAAFSIKGAEDVDRLRLGLAAAAINDARIDSRDLSLILSDLSKAAIGAGIDPRPHFQDVAEMSSRQRTGTYPGSMRTFLRLWSGV
jgi:hypothetical protein